MSEVARIPLDEVHYLYDAKMAGHGFPVIEIFGPTIQGEGPHAGQPCYFVRLGGCDYRCSWCDSMYAVEPAEVRAHAEKLTTHEIAERVQALGPPKRVVLSGGNPALHHLGDLVTLLQLKGYRVDVETQGSVWRDWLTLVNCLVVSPKPPSSGMATVSRETQTAKFLEKAIPYQPNSVLKIVVANDEDYEWAMLFHEAHPTLPFYLSVCTPQDSVDDDHMKSRVCRRFKGLAEKVADDERGADAKVLPQLHVLAWGAARGV